MRRITFALLLAGCAGSDTLVGGPAGQDRVVLKLVVEDLVRHPDFRVAADKSKLVVGDTTEGLSWYITTGQLSAELSERPPVSMELYNNLKFRNGRKMTIDAIDSPVVVMGTPDRRSDHPWVRFWLPAYAEDGLTALVRFGFGPTPHGACGTYFLAKDGGSWKILWSRLSFYA